MKEYHENDTTVAEPDQLAPEDVWLGYMSLAAQYGLGDEMQIGSTTAHHQATIEQEYLSYITAPLSSVSMDIIKFWEVRRSWHYYRTVRLIDSQVNGTTFPTLFKMAMNYLPVQASAVPCERIFSLSAETDMKKQNRISPLLMEALQMLKFHLKKECLNFTNSWVTAESQMTEDDPDAVDLLGNLL
jgi:hypothetical protein